MRKEIKNHDISARVVNSGSTHRKRLTYVVDKTDKTGPFPPDFDLGIIIRHISSQLQVFDFISDIIRLKGHTSFPVSDIKGYKIDKKHKKVIYVKKSGEFNLSLAMLAEPVYRQNGEFSYNDMIEPLTPNQRENSRTLKLMLQRNAAYASWNRAINGITIDEMTRNYGTLDECIEFLLSASTDSSQRKFFIAGKYDNLLQNVSPHVWERINLMSHLFLNERKAKANALSYSDWVEFNQDRSTIKLTIACSPGICGKEGSQIAMEVRQYLEKLGTESDFKRGVEYHIIPHQGNWWHDPRTDIYLSFDAKRYPAAITVELAQTLQKYMRRFENHSHLRSRYFESLSAKP